LEIPENKAETLDFARGLSVSEKPGREFWSKGASGGLVSTIASQGFAMLFMIPVVGFFILRQVAGASALVSGLVAGLVGALILMFGIGLLVRVNRANYKPGALLKDETDSRYRVRVVIPKKRQTVRVMRWVDAAVQGAVKGEVSEEEPVRAEDLETIAGGFDPIIVRPWFGIKRDRKYVWTAVIMGFVTGGAIMLLLRVMYGSWGDLWHSMSFMGYALTGAAIFGGLVCAEFLWPVYMRLVPGRLDLFWYGFLGSGKAEVETHDLKREGVCMDFGSYMMALEPERGLGEPLPELVKSEKWPHHQLLPDDYQPRYVSVTLVRGRRELAERVVQAARTEEETPPVSETELGG
jgi:hypothetical protein